MTRNRPSEPGAHGNAALADGTPVAHGNGDFGLRIGRSTMQPIADFIDDHLANHAGDPFLIWYAPFLPHVPLDAPERFQKMYADNPGVPRDLVKYSAGCTWFDETVGELVGFIESHGLAEDTLFLFVVDNGYRPEPGHGHELNARWHPRTKYSPFEGGVRTPILIRWDGQTIADTHEQLVSSLDIAPTLLEAAQASGDMGELPGISLLLSARGQKDPPERPAFGEIFPGDAVRLHAPEEHIAYRWVRDGDWKLIVPHEQRGEVWRSYVTSRSLFNLAEDPQEEHDLSRDPQYQGRLQHLQRLLDDWWNPTVATAAGTK